MDKPKEPEKKKPKPSFNAKPKQFPSAPKRPVVKPRGRG